MGYVYVPESERESRLLTEIERLKEENSALENSLVEQDFEMDRLTQANLKLCGEFMEQRRLIGELADAIEQYLNVDGSRKIYDASKLIATAGNLDYKIQRAREAIK